MVDASSQLTMTAETFALGDDVVVLTLSFDALISG